MALDPQGCDSQMASFTATTISAVVTAPNPGKKPAPAALCRWPHPELSIGERSGSMGFLGKYKCWKIKEKSPADLVWKNVSKPIVSLLEDQFEHLGAKDKLLQVEIFMVGKEAANSSPTILFSCEAKTCRRKAMELVEKNSILVHHPGVLMAECARLPRPLAKEELWSSDMEPGVYANGPLDHSGLSILVVGAKETLPRKATLGGIVWMNDEFYGLTAKHALMTAASSHPTEESDDDEFAFYGFGEAAQAPDDDDDDDDDDLLEITNHGNISSSSARSRSSGDRLKGTRSSETLSPDDPADISDQEKLEHEELPYPQDLSITKHPRPRIGELIAVTASDGGLDWALVKLRKDSVLFQKDSHSAQSREMKLMEEQKRRGFFMNKFIFRDLTSCRPERLAKSPRDADVTIFTGNHALPLHGRLSGVPSFIKPPGHIEFREFWTVTSINGGLLDEGDSGSWVVDQELRLFYGHITAGYPDAKTAYVVPAIHSFREIGEMVGPVSLPTRANWASDDTQHLGLVPSSTGETTKGKHVPEQTSPNRNLSNKCPEVSHPGALGSAQATQPALCAIESLLTPSNSSFNPQSQDSTMSPVPGSYVSNTASGVPYMGHPHLPVRGVGVLRESYSRQQGSTDLRFKIDYTEPTWNLPVGVTNRAPSSQQWTDLSYRFNDAGPTIPLDDFQTGLLHREGFPGLGMESIWDSGNYSFENCISPNVAENLPMTGLDIERSEAYGNTLAEAFDLMSPPSAAPLSTWNHSALSQSAQIPTFHSSGPISESAGTPVPDAITGDFKCAHCMESFMRISDHNRHVTSVHGINSATHLCPVPGCPRGEGAGYSRADKLTEHMWKKHGTLGFTKTS